MRKVLIGFAWIVVAMAAATGHSARAQTAKNVSAQDCASAATQARMNECAYEDFLAATAGYAASYKAISDKLAGRQRDQFRRTQKRWIQYRTAACNFESSGVQGGSAQGMVKWRCDTRMTRVRTAELEKWASCQEGDLNCLRFGK